MQKNNFLLLLFLLSFTINNYAQQNKIYTASSPGNTTRIEIKTDSKGNCLYRAFYSGKEIITWSPLGFIMNDIRAGERTTIAGALPSTYNGIINWPLGENDRIENNYREIRVLCQSPGFTFAVIARVFDGSIAFRYAVPPQASFKSAVIQKENTGFNFTGAYTLWQYNRESVFSPVGTDTFTTSCDLPATLTNQHSSWVSIGEANNRNYTKVELKRGNDPHSLNLVFLHDSTVIMPGTFETPWRTISFSNTAIGLHRYSELFLKLNPPPASGVPAWIKPGKLIRSQLTTQSGIDCIDFAAKHHFQYILFDAGWYGAEFRSVSDPTIPIPQIDMQKVIQYGKEKGIGVILYVNYVGLKAKLDTLLPLYKQWGVSGLKFGFVDGLTQAGLTWLTAAIEKVNEYGFILDIHDNYKPTGLSRTYPALLTQEGIRGNENSPDAFHTTLLPFTRFLAGAADYTFCYPNEKNSYSKNLHVSKAHQLALTVIFFSPLQAIFWYGLPNDYTNEQEIEFFTRVPTVWSESHYMAGQPGENISVARRQKDDWYVGNISGPGDWKSSIQLNFLTAGKTYTATIYEDDEAGSIRKKTLVVKKGDVFPIALKAATGQAIIMQPNK